MAGKIIITLDEYRRKHNISKYKICRDCKLQPTQLNKYCSNNVARVDLDVLTRICDFLHCDISDILKYTPENEN